MGAITYHSKLHPWHGGEYWAFQVFDEQLYLVILFDMIHISDVVGWECSACGQMFSDATFLTSHKLIKHGIRSYCCQICGFYMKSEAVLMKHLEVRYHQSGPVLDRHTTDTDLTSLAVLGGHPAIQTVPGAVSTVSLDGHMRNHTCTEFRKGFTHAGNPVVHTRDSHWWASIHMHWVWERVYTDS